MPEAGKKRCRAIRVCCRRRWRRYRTNPLLWVAALLGVMALYFGAVVFFAGRPKDPGNFGDVFGGMTALFSGGALVGVVLAVLLQREEIRLQREDLRHTREEIHLQREEMEKMSKAQREQAASSWMQTRVQGASAVVAFHEQRLASHLRQVELANEHMRKVGPVASANVLSTLQQRREELDRKEEQIRAELLRVSERVAGLLEEIEGKLES